MFKLETRQDIISAIMLSGTLMSLFMYVTLEVATYTIGLDVMGFWVKLYTGFMCVIFVLFFVENYIARIEQGRR